MKKLHWYEYERTKKANSSFLIGSVFSLSMFIFFFVCFGYIEKNFDLTNLNNCNLNTSNWPILLDNMIEIIHRFWMIDVITLPFSVVFMKSKQDILSGVSKLDDLLMVSVF